MENLDDILVWLGLGGVVIGIIAKTVLKKKPPSDD